MELKLASERSSKHEALGILIYEEFCHSMLVKLNEAKWENGQQSKIRLSNAICF